MKRRHFIFSLAGILLLPVVMWTAWLTMSNKKIVVAIVDKTKSIKKGNRHLSLTWVLDNEKYTKASRKLYKVDHDYFGFHQDDENQSYRVKGLERFSNAQLDQLSTDCDAAYYVDTYGVYKNDLSTGDKLVVGQPLIYGGMSQQDIYFLNRMKEQKKLIIAEYNTMEPPTPVSIRDQFEKMFKIKWTGWTGKYFDSFDPKKNKDIPMWLINNYKIKHGGAWPFTKAGIAFVNNEGGVFVLEEGADLKDPQPFISVDNKGVLCGLPNMTKYAFWFDIIELDTAINKVVATYNINYNAQGRQQLQAHNIPLHFPAVVMNKKEDYQFYYFSGDFCTTNNLSISSSHFIGISIFKWFLRNEDDTLEDSNFFWNFYRPLLTTILKIYYKKKVQYSRDNHRELDDQ